MGARKKTTNKVGQRLVKTRGSKVGSAKSNTSASVKDSSATSGSKRRASGKRRVGDTAAKKNGATTSAKGSRDKPKAASEKLTSANAGSETSMATNSEAKDESTKAASVKARPTERGRTKRTAVTGPAVEWDVEAVLGWLRAHSSMQTLEGMARYAIPSDHALGVAMRDMKVLGKLIGRDHLLALALWKTGVYEARVVAGFVADPNLLTAEEMETWCRDFDNWAYCDTLCFSLFDRSPYAWSKVYEWATREKEFEKRTAFALLWSLALHDKQTKDSTFADALELVEQAAVDERNFVKKAVSMALKAVGKRNATLRLRAKQVAARLAASAAPAAKWIGKDALKELA